jgi:hypothetical protein
MRGSLLCSQVIIRDGRIAALELCRTEQDENGKWVCCSIFTVNAIGKTNIKCNWIFLFILLDDLIRRLFLLFLLSAAAAESAIG